MVALPLLLFCNTLQQTATNCNKLQDYLKALLQTNTLHHAVIHCNTLQEKYQNATYKFNTLQNYRTVLPATHSNTLQHTTPHCTTLHHTAPRGRITAQCCRERWGNHNKAPHLVRARLPPSALLLSDFILQP